MSFRILYFLYFRKNNILDSVLQLDILHYKLHKIKKLFTVRSSLRHPSDDSGSTDSEREIERGGKNERVGERERESV